MPIERLSLADLTVLASDRGSVPMNMGALLELDSPSVLSLADLRSLLAARVPRVTRLRQRLAAAPLGCGRPAWIDDPDFHLDRHLGEQVVPPPGGRQGLMDAAAELVCRRLDPERPLWHAWLLSDDASARCALVLVVHHVLADGLGGLAVLAELSDGAPTVPPREFPHPPPTRRELFRDAARDRAAAVAAAPRTVRLMVAGLRELGLRRATRLSLVAETSLLGPTSDQRRLATVDLPLAEVRSLAHRIGGTVNDVMLAAVSGALLTAMRTRGEDPSRLVISVPISGRRAGETDRLGNHTGVRPIAVPAILDDHFRLATIVALTRAQAATPRATSAAPLGLVFRLLRRLGLFRVFVEHQRLVHTFETNLRGPSAALSLGGHRIGSVIPVVVNPGNVGISFVVLSYAGSLGVTLVADPLIVPDQDAVAESLAAVAQRLLAG
jgi:WS/DGAT/MGAT family acyltransferase